MFPFPLKFLKKVKTTQLLRSANDSTEIVSFQARPSDERPVDVRLAQKLPCVAWFDRPAIEDSG
jgi:hypothetical protein